jgi:UDP-2,4-diacetamido-2,4,6-trideoxy-beta-L-altropyranose hydrolase
MPPGQPIVIFRVDASVAMGTGHVMRCIALAQAWQDQNAECMFAAAESTSASGARLRDEKFEFVRITASLGSPEDASQLVRLGIARHASWIVVDGYQFGVEYQRAVKAAGLKLLVIDDTAHVGAYAADLVLDQNAHTDENLYQHKGTDTRLLLGSRYALLRREFKAWREWNREIAPRGRKVLVTIGGSDPDNLTLIAIRALNLVASDQLEATVVVGGSNPYGDQIEAETRNTDGSIRLLKDVFNMPELMADADAAISGAGSTCWEMCFLGLPAIVIDVADNQRPIGQELDRRGIAIHLGSSVDITAEKIADQLKMLLVSQSLRATMSERARNLVDGRGAERVVAAMTAGSLRLRRAQAEDCELLFEWANDPGVRANSFSSDVISWERHREWFDKKITDPNVILYVVMGSNDCPIGQVRYDIDGLRALISISLGAGFRGKGYGGNCLSLALEELFRSTNASLVDAYVKPANESSLRMFLNAGFQRQEDTSFAGQPAVHLILEKNRFS